MTVRVFGLAALILWQGAIIAEAADLLVAAAPGQAQALFDSGQVEPGDRVILAAGRHGALTVKNRAYDPPVTLMSEAGGRAVLDELILRESSGLRVSGLAVLPQPDTVGKPALVTVRNARDIVLDRLVIASAEDATGWSKQDWSRRARSGVWLEGRDIALTNSFVRIVDHAITAVADGARVENNFVELFAGDGIRGLGDDSRYVGNTVETCVGVDGNHDDGFQSWSLDANGTPGKGVVRNVVVEGNVIRNGNHPFTCQLQGIGLFDGFYEDWTIRNNTVIVDQWHGITVMGARRVTVIGNIVADSRPGRPGPPWIRVSAHKDGRPAEDSVVAGNSTERAVMVGDGTKGDREPGVRFSNNRTGVRP